MWYVIFGLLFPQMICAQPEKWIIDDVLDCERPLSMTNAPISKICNPQQANTIPGLTWERNVTYSILQYDDNIVIKGIKCSKQESSFQFYCGRWSHAVWTEPPTLLRPVEVSRDECTEAYSRHIYMTEHGQTIPIPKGGYSTISYSYAKVGSVVHTMDSAWCENGKSFEKGLVHENLVVMIDAKFTIQEIEIQVAKGFLKDLSTNLILPEPCQGARYCVLPTETYILMGHVNRKCHLHVVRERLTFDQYSVLEGNKKSTFLVSNPHKLLFVEKGTRQGTHEACFPPNVSLISTQLPAILLVKSGLTAKHRIPKLHGEGVNLDLEVKVAEAYVLFKSQERLMNLLKGIDARFCETDVKTLPLYQRSPFTPHHLLRIHGELVQELKCKEVSVEIPLGQLFDVCYNALPVFYNGHLRFVTPIDHILLTEEDVIHVPCKLAPKFIVNSTVISATPRLSTERGLKLTDLTYRYHRSIDNWSSYGLRHMNKFMEAIGGGDDTLYNEAEMKEYLELAHFDRKRQEVQSILTNAYCADQSCGSYHSTQGYFPLDISPLKVQNNLDVYQSMLHPVETFWTHIKTFLTWFTLYLFVEWLAKLIYAGVQCLQMVRFENFSKKDAVQISFNPGGQVTQTFRDLKRKRVKWEDEQDLFTEADLAIEPELNRLADEVAATRAARRAAKAAAGEHNAPSAEIAL